MVLIQDPRTGKTVQAVKRADLQAAGVKVAEKKAPTYSYAAQNARYTAEREKRQARAAALTAANFALVDRTLQAMAGRPRTVPELLWIARQVFAGTEWETRLALVERHGLACHPDAFGDELAGWSADQLALFAVECVLLEDALVGTHELDRLQDKAQILRACAAQYGVSAEAEPTLAKAARAHEEAVEA